MPLIAPSRRPGPGGLARLVDRLSPGGHPVRARRLPGGLGSRMHVLDIKQANGSRLKVSLRRYSGDQSHRYKSSEHADYDFRLLRLVESAGILAPRPLLLDANGEYFGVPAMVLSYLHGRPLFSPRDQGAWLHGLARALLSVHAVTPDRFDLSKLHSNLPTDYRAEIARRYERALASESLARQIHAVLEAEIDALQWPVSCLVHDDYWPGNTIWYRGRLAGIVDWTTGKLGDPRVDVAQCRLDLVLIHGSEVADSFLDCYQRAAPAPLSDIWFFDLLRGLPCLFSYESWLEGYHDAGLTHLTAADVGERLRAFLRRVLDERPRVDRS